MSVLQNTLVNLNMWLDLVLCSRGGEQYSKVCVWGGKSCGVAVSYSDIKSFTVS